MNDSTRLVADWLDQQMFNSYTQDLGEFRGDIIEALTDCGSDVWQSGLITIALREADWALLHEREFHRHVRAQREADKNRKEQEKLGDIPF